MPDLTVDNENFSAGGAPSSDINQIIWSGLTGLYFAAAQGGILQSMDQGVSWGDFRPNTALGTTWPADAVAHQMGFGVGPRRCLLQNTTPFFFAVDNDDQGDASVSGVLYKYDPVAAAWNKVSEQSFSNALTSIASYGDKVVLCAINASSQGSVFVSTDGGLTFTEVRSPVDWAYWAAYDSAGRLWLAYEAISGVSDSKIEIYRSDLGDGSDLVLITTFDLTFGGSSITGPNKLIACHPTNRNIVAVVVNDQEISNGWERSVYVTTDDGANWTQYVLPDQNPLMTLAYAEGDIVITPTEILVQLSLDDGVSLRYTYVSRASLSDLGSGFTNEEIFAAWRDGDFGQVSRMAAFGSMAFASVFRVPTGGGNPPWKIGIAKSTGGAFADFVTWTQTSSPNNANDGPGYMGNMHYDSVADVLWAFFQGGPVLYGSSLQDREFRIDSAGTPSAAGVTNEDGSAFGAGPG